MNNFFGQIAQPLFYIVQPLNRPLRLRPDGRRRSLRRGEVRHPEPQRHRVGAERRHAEEGAEERGGPGK